MFRQWAAFQSMCLFSVVGLLTVLLRWSPNMRLRSLRQRGESAYNWKLASHHCMLSISLWIELTNHALWSKFSRWLNQMPFRCKGEGDSMAFDENMERGTVVDTDIVSPKGNEFILCSHLTLQGTVRPTRYTIYQNTPNLHPNDLQVGWSFL